MIFLKVAREGAYGRRSQINIYTETIIANPPYLDRLLQEMLKLMSVLHEATLSPFNEVIVNIAEHFVRYWLNHVGDVVLQFVDCVWIISVNFGFQVAPKEEIARVEVGRSGWPTTTANNPILEHILNGGQARTCCMGCCIVLLKCAVLFFVIG